VLHIHRRQVNPGPAAQQAGNFVNLFRALQDNGVNGVPVKCTGVHLPH
jgi:hypothetical protein